MYHRHLKTPSLLQVHGTTSSVVFVFTPLTIRTLHLPATSHDSVRVVQKVVDTLDLTCRTCHLAGSIFSSLLRPVTNLQLTGLPHSYMAIHPYPLLGFCALYTQTMRYAILNQLRVNMREKNIENLHPSQKPIIPIQVQHPGHPNVAQPTPSAMQNDTKWCKMMQNGAKWCKMIQIPAGGNSCCTQRRCHPWPPLTRPQPHHRHSLEWCAVLCSGESSETRKLLP